MKLQIDLVWVLGKLADGVGSFTVSLRAEHCCIQLHLCTEALIVCVSTLFGFVM